MPHLSTALPITVRVPPQESFSRIDRRLLREYAERLTGEAIALYLILAGRQRRAGFVVLQRRLDRGPFDVTGTSLARNLQLPD